MKLSSTLRSVTHSVPYPFAGDFATELLAVGDRRLAFLSKIRFQDADKAPILMMYEVDYGHLTGRMNQVYVH